MVKADPKRNYYADLEIPLNATNDDIKRQYRKLARLYHPDRNQGKEHEFVPKFQAIQTAHEILGDPNERAKYDADRKKLGYLNKPVRPTFATAHTASGRGAPPRHPNFFHTSYAPPNHNAASPHPPKPPPRPQPQFHQAPPPPNASKPSWYGAAHTAQPQSPYTASHARSSSSATSGASRFSNFHPPSARASTSKDDPNMRANAFSAWQSMHNRGTRSSAGTGQNTPAASTPGSEDERRFNSEGPFGRASAANPGVRRSHTTRTPRKAGFDPNSLGDSWEPPATRTSSYNTRHSFAAQGGQGPSENASATESTQDDGSITSDQPRKRHSHHDLRPSASAPDQPVFGDRLSAPYQGAGGEKVHLNSDMRRSASVRDATKLGARFDIPDSSPSSRGTTPRSQSVNARSTESSRRQAQQPSVIDLTDSSDSPPPRPMARPSRKWQSPSKEAPSNHQARTRSHNSDPEGRPSINTEFSSSEDFQGFRGSDGFAPPPKTTSNSRSRVSPTRKVQSTTDPSQFPDPFRSIFPQLPSMKPAPSNHVSQDHDPTGKPVKFDPEAWARTFKEPSFFIPNPDNLSSQNARPASSSTRRQNKPHAMSKSSEQLGSNRKASESNTTVEPSSSSQADGLSMDDDDAMDLDSEMDPVGQTRSSDVKSARNVTMPPHRKSWHTTEDSTQASSNPSTLHVSPAPFPAVPTAVPNAMPPPPPPPGPPPKRSPLSPKGRDPTSPISQVNGTSPSMNLADLGQNLTSRGYTGVADLNDLTTTLPFESRSSDKNPKAPTTGLLNIPKPPVAPPAPMAKKLMHQQWKIYVSAMSVYMGQWYQWDNRILEHMQTRHRDSAKFGTGLPSVQATALLEARGDVAVGGIERWEAELEQDRRVREFWSAACNKHQKCVREFVSVKKRVAVDGLLPG